MEHNHQHAGEKTEWLEEVHRRRNRHLAGESKSFTWEETLEIIRNRIAK